MVLQIEDNHHGETVVAEFGTRRDVASDACLLGNVPDDIGQRSQRQAQAAVELDQASVL